MSSFRRTIFHRRKKNKNDEQNDHDEASSLNSTIHSDVMPHSLSAGMDNLIFRCGYIYLHV